VTETGIAITEYEDVFIRVLDERGDALAELIEGRIRRTSDDNANVRSLAPRSWTSAATRCANSQLSGALRLTVSPLIRNDQANAELRQIQNAGT